MDALLRLCISDSSMLVCSTRGGVVRWGVGKQGGGKGLVGERGEGGGVCVAQKLPKPVTLKRRSLKVARLQASQLAGLIHCPWLGCLYVSICCDRLFGSSVVTIW